MSTNLNMTKYFRDSIAAKLGVNFKDKRFKTVSLESIRNGRIEENVFNGLKGNIRTDKLDIIIVLKTIKTVFSGQEKINNNNIEELRGICYIPAVLNKNGKLSPVEEKYPWIPREHLYPIIEKELAIGILKEYDEFFSDQFHRLHNISKWDDYFQFVQDMYETVTETKLQDSSVKGIKLEENVYVIKDETVDATRNILKLYDHLLENDLKQLPLFQNFIKQEFTNLQPIIPNTIKEMKQHLAQMGGEYPLSPSQRECVNHFNNMEPGDILAINGPPGTGKTTLLQSLVANLVVEKALKREKAPLIVASSTNNQAVTNIIESFGKIKPKWEKCNLEQRWINSVNSFAVYFPSTSKEKDASKKGFQYTNPKGENFFSEIESEENIQVSTKKMIEQSSIYFDKKISSIQQCESIIHERLLKLETIRDKLLDVFNEFEEIGVSGQNIEDYLSHLNHQKETFEIHLDNLKNRVQEWKTHFNNIPILYRLLFWLPSFKRKIINLNSCFLNKEEDFLNEEMNKEEIIFIYSQKIKGVREKIREIEKKLNISTQLNSTYQSIIKELEKDELVNKGEISLTSLREANEFLDMTIRYASFWMAVHYYECRWLTQKRLTEKQIGKNYRNVLEQLYSNLSMVTPCFVMTFYQLPKMLLAYDGGKQHFLYNLIDLLIVDEAGQVTPEVAACSFSLAKQAVVVGDVHQIEPVWNINSSLDRSLALSAGVISTEEQFLNLTEVGLTTSDSSVMKIACKSSKYQKFNERGLFLSEHRRCYDEIIEYSNKLVYKGNLEPKRGKGKEDSKYPLNHLAIPHLGHKQVASLESTKKAGSRFNEREAIAIANWIQQHFGDIKRVYPKEDPKSLFGVITPFKMQVGQIKKALPQDIKNYIEVGTVHTFQGGERRIIIMSTVYGKKDGCFFIDATKSLLNVAVSRAKDSFLVFGEIECLSQNKNKPSGLLKKLITNNPL